MRRLTIRQRLVLLALLPGTLIAVILTIYLTLSGIGTLDSQLHTKGLTIARQLASISEYAVAADQIKDLDTLTQATLRDSDLKSVVFVGQKAQILATSGRVSLSSEHLRMLPGAPGVVAESEDWVAFGAPIRRLPREAETPSPASKAVAAEEAIGGAVFVEIARSQFTARQQQLLTRGVLILALGVIILAALAIALAIAVADHIVRPINNLATAAEALAAGRLETRVELVSGSEFGRLEHNFNKMAEYFKETQLTLLKRVEEATAQLSWQARHDALTGLLNRDEFEHRLENALATAQVEDNEGALLFIRLDRFGLVNNACGHLAGDELLRQIALLFQGRLREEDALARFYGDEFGIILNYCKSAHARQLATDLCGLVGAFRFIWQGKVFTISASIGLTPVNHQARHINGLIAACDAACQRAKESGGNQVCEQPALATPDRRHEYNGWINRIADALVAGHVQIEAMPLRALQPGLPDDQRVELSASLQAPGQPPVALPALLEAAERHHLTPIIDMHLVEAAINALTVARQHDQPLFCLTPLSGSALSDHMAIDSIKRRLQARGIDGSGLALMFPEEVAVRLASPLFQFAQEVRRLGCQIGLCDFGGGLSSFMHLRNINPDFIKLSRRLTHNLSGSRASTALLRAIQEIANDQGMISIAYSMDADQGIKQLKQLGIGYAVGNAVAPCEPFAVWLQDMASRRG